MTLQEQGYSNVPSWHDLAGGQSPPGTDPFEAEAGEVRAGWQGEAAQVDHSQAAAQYMESLSPSNRARLRSCAGPNAAWWMTAIPSEAALRLDAPAFRTALLRRLGLPVDVMGGECEGCHTLLDDMGYHRTTCMRTGRVQTRHTFLLKTAWRRIFREAGVSIPDRNVERTLRTTHINRGSDDNRRMDLVCSGIDGVFGGVPLFADVTCVSPLHGNGTPMPHAADEEGAAVNAVESRNRETDYPDVHASPQAQLLSLGVETYGRWHKHCLVLVRQLARNKARNASELLAKPMELAYYRRWWSLLSVAVQRVVTEGILRPAGADLLEACSTIGDICAADVLDFNR